ncbi:pentapeptide repeat-containing protein [Ruthenibacterium lactatiformans]|jgi:hypothetical protein|uniref:pentapeptide repeat-containing protein n=1 Tax=Ruthenibacterium lactatiformans TaxID=1550024 RepID=UPI0019678CAD|nr:pentapeptide repeat-containing protein [Ruthenibacterium lactatiformans]MBN3010985.1 pentapeptide repeat-containing protein [Ruthenibacterium lactatiformans]MDU5533966.1 pentapeptide repeat-containing protein [Oscillospiraceae bacterium]
MPDKVIGIINYLGPNGEIGETQDFTDVNEYLSGIEKAFDEYGINGWRYVTQTNDLDVNYKVYVLASGEFGKEPISRKAFHLQHPEYVLPPVTFGVVEDTPWGRMKVVRQQDFDKAFAQGATDFSNCYFEDVTFSGEAAEISFQNSILANGCQFDHAHFKGASFDGASIYCSIQDCDLSRSSFLHTTINGHIKRTDLSGCFFKDSHINKTSFADCILNRCIMYETALNSTYFVRCEAFGLQHMDTMRLTMGGATDREVENYIRQVTEALTPKAYEDLFCQIRAEISNGRFHIYDIEHSSTPLVGEGSVPQGLTPEAAAKQWLRGPNGAPYRMRGVHAYENLLEIPEDKRLVELDHDTFQWCPRKEVALSGIDQALSQYVKTWRQQEQPKGASTPKSNAERKSAVDIAKEQIQNLCNSFKKDPQQYVEYLKFSARFYKYSGRNMMLIYHQKPSANFVASRTAFKDMGYDLKPGQWKYPAWIIRPETKTLFVTADGVVADIKCATAQEKADIRDGKIPTEKFTYFRAAKVYEIGQTTCPAKDYPQILGHGIDDQQHKELYTRLQAVAGMSGFIVSEEPLPSSEFGYCSHDKRIVISDSLGDTQKLATLNHEFAHGLLHLTSDLSPAVEEFEAESVALIMQQRLGLPVEDLTVQYVKNALREAGNLPEFSMEESLGRIVKQANYVCDRLELQRIQQQEVMPVQNQTPVIQAQPNFGLTL